MGGALRLARATRTACCLRCKPEPRCPRLLDERTTVLLTPTRVLVRVGALLRRATRATFDSHALSVTVADDLGREPKFAGRGSALTSHLARIAIEQRRALTACTRARPTAARARFPGVSTGPGRSVRPRTARETRFVTALSTAECKTKQRDACYEAEQKSAHPATLHRHLSRCAAAAILEAGIVHSNYPLA